MSVSKNKIKFAAYVRSLKEIGVGIYFEEQNIDTLKSDSELYLVIYAGFAQSESESISKNITWTHRKNFEDGKPIFMYSRMLGYRKGEDGNPEIVPEEAAIVQRVFDMYLSGKSTDEISEILQAEKIVIPGKKLTFSKSMIIRMLKTRNTVEMPFCKRPSPSTRSPRSERQTKARHPCGLWRTAIRPSLLVRYSIKPRKNPPEERRKRPCHRNQP